MRNGQLQVASPKKFNLQLLRTEEVNSATTTQQISLQALAAHVLLGNLSRNSHATAFLCEVKLMQYEERAAILEFDGEHTRKNAELLALEEVLNNHPEEK